MSENKAHVCISKKLHIRLKALAKRSGKKMEAVGDEAVVRYLSAEKTKPIK